MRFLLASLCLIITFLAQADSTDQQLTALVSDYWQNYLRENPVAATYAGTTDYNDQLAKVSPQDYARRLQQNRHFLQRLKAIDSSSLKPASRTTHTVLHFILSHEINQAPFKLWRMPLMSDSGFHTEFNSAARATPFRSINDYQDYLKRLEALPGFLEQNVDNMRLGLKAGFTQPAAILENLKPSFAGQVTEAAEAHPLYQPFNNLPDSINAETAAELQRQAAGLLRNQVIPAFAMTQQFFVEEYIPGSRATLGAYQLPDGKAMYAELVRFYTSLESADADDIHQLGLREVARIRSDMQDIIEQLDFEGDFAEFIHFLRTDPQFYADSAEQLLKEAAWIAKRIDGVMPQLFGKLPRQPYGIEPVPAGIAPNYTTGRYVPAPLDADRGGYYWVNTYALDKRPLYNLPALTLHEGVPGHHHQIALSKEAASVPEFRQNYYFNAFGEGWGLYAEKLGMEIGIYRTPYEHFGRLSYEMWRACRLVIDTGIHAKGWTRQQAIDYLAGNTALSLLNVRTEIDRYISWPGQALAYKMGELTILDLRNQAENALGSDFDIRAFHDAILTDGSIPLDLLRQKIAGYIKTARH